jgi:hypothetical protein
MSVIRETTSVEVHLPSEPPDEPGCEGSGSERSRRAEIDAILSILASTGGQVGVDASALDSLYSRAAIAARIARRVVADPLLRPGTCKFGTAGRMSSGLCAMRRQVPSW